MTTTKSFSTPDLKAFFEKTSLSSLMQGGHQSDPVNFTRIHFFSAAAFFFPASKSVRKSPACAVAGKATEKMARMIVFSGLMLVVGVSSVGFIPNLSKYFWRLLFSGCETAIDCGDKECP